LDELLSWGIGLGGSIWFGRRWIDRLGRGVGWCSVPRRVSAALAVLPVALLVGLAFALRAAAAREVREDGAYVLLFVLLGAVWLGVAVEALSWLGLSIDDDVVDRRNPAAAWALAGALVSVSLSYGFANFGEGETIWTTLGPAQLALVACLLLWAAHQRVSGAADAIGIDRDASAGLRFAGMAIATGLIIGRAMAGDYVSAEATVADLWRQGWPAPVVVVLAAGVERAVPVTPSYQRRLLLDTGFVPAVAYVGIGVVDVLWLGPWWRGGAP
jgi:hypothetical protein